MDIRRVNTADLKFTRHTAGYNLLDHRRSEELRVDLVEKKIAQYQGLFRWG
jgi:hypothetical protein